MMILRNSLLIVISFLVTLCTTGQGYEIKIKINGLSEKPVILGHYLSKSMYPDDTVKLDAKGSGVFTGLRKLPEGMYLFYLPNSSYFEVIMGEDQSFSIEVDTVDFLRTLSIKGSEENQVFLDFQKYMMVLRREADSLTQLMKSRNDPKDKELLSGKLRKINENRIIRIESICEEHPGWFVSAFLKATVDVAVPEPPRDGQGRIKDSTWQYYYYRSHYFDNFDIADARLLRTPLYEDKIMTYLSKVIPQIPDSIIPVVDHFIEKSRADSAVFRYMLITLFNYYGKSNIMGMDAVQVHIADNYYIRDSWWSDDKFIADLKDRTEKARPLLIGRVAPDIELMLVPPEHFASAATDTALKKYPHVGTKINLSRIKAKYMVLVFWEAECGHCKTIIPELYKIYQRSLQKYDVKILAVSTLFGEDGKVKWVDFVNQYSLYDWMNAWNPYSYVFKLKYDVLTTPQIYILDENKKIIAKKVGPEQVEEILLSLNGS
jgi:thiol-disulfide isomerase/thioredoxin